MNKADIIAEVSKVLTSKKDAVLAVEKIFEEMSNALKRGNKVSICGFGSFNMFVTKVKKGRNPKTGKTLLLAPKKKIRFKQSKDFFGDK
ncbi:MAG: integration host factor subunit beta [Elusimicrobiota bacterium]|jgi:nucleoid DNA-binding protein|nr:integration host factor subunit beta [Elusimicrobiota bacterium]